MNPQPPYIQRQETIKLAQNLRDGIKKPQDSPLLFNIYGKDGIGKTTALDELSQTFGTEFQCVKISFGINSLIKTVIDLMRAIDNQVKGDVNGWEIENFSELRKKYDEACQKLASEAAKEESAGSEEKNIESIKQSGKAVLKGVLTVTGGAFPTAGIASPLLNPVIDSAFDIDSLFRKNKLTKNNLELQELVRNPIPKLAKVFVDDLIKKSQCQPILLIIDNYKQVSWEFNIFLGKFILSNRELQNSPIRIVMAGESSLKNERYQGIYRQHDHLIWEKQLDEFNFEETKNYLSEIGIPNSRDISLCWSATQGYPYHLNLIRQQQVEGKQIRLSFGVREMRKILLDGFSELEKKVVILAAYCRYFDQDIIEYLLRENNIEEDPPKYPNWFEWLISLNFVIEEGNYYLDDVARSIIRQTEHKNNKRQFRDRHKQLADYYQHLSKIEIDDRFGAERYQYIEWCDYMIESNYHRLYANRNQGQNQLLNCFFEGTFFSNPNVAIKSYLAIDDEYNIEINCLLPNDTRKWLQSIYLAINVGWLLLTEDPKTYTVTFDDNGQSIKPEIEQSLLHCYQKSDYLDSLPKIVSLISQVHRQNKDTNKVKLLSQAKKQLKEIENKQNPKIVTFVLNYIGNMFIQQGLDNEALELYQKAATIDSSDAQSLNNMGGHFYYAERYDEAVDVLIKAIKIEPENATLHSNMGIILDANNDSYLALESFEKALDLDSSNSGNWMNHALILLKMEKYYRAIESLDKSLALDPSNVITIVNYSLALLNLGRNSEALKMINRAIAIDSDNISIWLKINLVLGYLEYFERASQCLDKALSIEPNNSKVWYEQGSNQFYLRNFERAMENLRKALQKNPNNEITVGCHNLMALCLSFLGRFSESLQQIEISLEYSIDDNLLIANKGIILARQGKYSEAMACCESAITINSDNENGYYAQACCYALQNDEQQAIENLNKAIAIAPLRCRLEARVNPDFDSLRNKPEFKALLTTISKSSELPETTISEALLQE